MPFECSLCQLCAAVCPVDVNPANMFLEMRRESVSQGNGDYPEHSVILGYERRGTSKRYTYYALPLGCDTIFFPGCTLPGTRPDKTLRLYEHIKKDIPTLGIVLDCCTRPSHDLGRTVHFTAMFGEMKHFLGKNGVREVLVACPSCYEIFSRYGRELSVKTVYEFMAENGLPRTERVAGTVTVHDPCAVRYSDSIHSAVRNLCMKKGLTIEEMPHHGRKTLCCGEGGAVGCTSPGLAEKWGTLRKAQSNGRRIISYCAGCTDFLGPMTPTSHILDLVFEPQPTLAGRVKISKAPISYLNRIRLKKCLKKIVDPSVTRERTFTAEGQRKKGGMIKRLLSLFYLCWLLLWLCGSWACQVCWSKRCSGNAFSAVEDSLGYPQGYLLNYGMAIGSMTSLSRPTEVRTGILPLVRHIVVGSPHARS